MAGPYALPINQNDENFRKQLNAFLGDIDTRIAAAAAGSAFPSEGDVISDAYTALTLAISTAVQDGVGLRDLYADQSGIDAANSSGLVFAVGDVSNMSGSTATQAPLMTSATTPAGESASAVSSATGHPPWMAFDGSASTYWSSNGTPASSSSLLTRNLAASFAANAVTFDTTGASNLPSSWSVAGSSDNSNFTILYTSTAAMQPNTVQTYILSNVASYSYYQLRSSAFSGTGPVIIAEMALKAMSPAPANAVLRSASAGMQAAPSRGYLFSLGKLASGAVLNTDLIGSVSRDAAAFAAGTLKPLATLSSGYPFLGLYGSDGKLGVDVSGQGAGQAIIGKLAMTNKARIDIAGLRTRGA